MGGRARGGEEGGRPSGDEPHGGRAGSYRQGELLRLLGRLGEAEEAYRSASANGREPQPGLALLRVAQGNEDAAAAAMRRALGEAADPLRRAALLPAFVEVMVATGENRRGGARGRRAGRDRRRLGGGALPAAAAQARGAVASRAATPRGR